MRGVRGSGGKERDRTWHNKHSDSFGVDHQGLQYPALAAWVNLCTSENLPCKDLQSMRENRNNTGTTEGQPCSLSLCYTSFPPSSIFTVGKVQEYAIEGVHENPKLMKKFTAYEHLWLCRVACSSTLPSSASAFKQALFRLKSYQC